MSPPPSGNAVRAAVVHLMRDMHDGVGPRTSRQARISPRRRCLSLVLPPLLLSEVFLSVGGPLRTVKTFSGADHLPCPRWRHIQRVTEGRAPLPNYRLRILWKSLASRHIPSRQSAGAGSELAVAAKTANRRAKLLTSRRRPTGGQGGVAVPSTVPLVITIDGLKASPATVSVSCEFP